MHSFLSDITVLPVFVLKTVLQPITLFGRRIKAQEKMSRENLSDQQDAWAEELKFASEVLLD